MQRAILTLQFRPSVTNVINVMKTTKCIVEMFSLSDSHISPERQSARMSKITNDGLTRSGAGGFSCTHMATVGVKGLSCTRKH